MNAFAFSLERVLAWRRTQLSIEEADLQKLRSELRVMETAVVELANWHDASIASIGKVQAVTGGDIAGLARAQGWTITEEKRLRTKLADCGRRLEQRLETVSEARRKVRLLERLKERRREGWKDEFNRELEQLAGESALIGWRRNQHNSSEADVPASG
jgi:flagellar export protein FliJ